jgi:exodeoxyribonuclease-3
LTIATYNVNGINGRLEILLRWLKEDRPDVVCLLELKSKTIPEKEPSRADTEPRGMVRSPGTVSPFS